MFRLVSWLEIDPDRFKSRRMTAALQELSRTPRNVSPTKSRTDSLRAARGGRSQDHPMAPSREDGTPTLHRSFAVEENLHRRFPSKWRRERRRVLTEISRDVSSSSRRIRKASGSTLIRVRSEIHGEAWLAGFRTRRAASPARLLAIAPGEHGRGRSARGRQLHPTSATLQQLRSYLFLRSRSVAHDGCDVCSFRRRPPSYFGFRNRNKIYRRFVAPFRSMPQGIGAA